MRDISISPQMDDKLFGTIDMRLGVGEFAPVAVDPPSGQLGRNKRKKGKRDQAIPYAHQLHAVQVVRGAPVSVLLAGPMFSGNIPAAGELYAQKFSARHRNALLYLNSDTANSRICATAGTVFPNLRRCAIDPIRLAMDTATTNYGKRHAPAPIVRKVISKFNPTCVGDREVRNFTMEFH